MWKTLVTILAVLAFPFANSEFNLVDWPYGKIPTEESNHSLVGKNETNKSILAYYNQAHNNDPPPEDDKNAFENRQEETEKGSSFVNGYKTNENVTGRIGNIEEEEGTYEYTYTGNEGEEVKVFASEPEYDWNDFEDNLLNGAAGEWSNSFPGTEAIRTAKAVTIENEFANSTGGQELLNVETFGFTQNSSDVETVPKNANATGVEPVIVRQVDDDADPPKRCRIHHYHHHYHNQVHKHYHCYHDTGDKKPEPPPNQQVIQHVHHHHGCEGKKQDAARKLFDDNSNAVGVSTENGTSPISPQGAEDAESSKGPDKAPDKGPDNEPDRAPEKGPDKPPDKVPDQPSEQHIIHHHHYHHHSHCRHIHHHVHHHRHDHHHHFQHCPKNPQGGVSRGEFDVTGNDIVNPYQTNADPVVPSQQPLPASAAGIYAKSEEDIALEFTTTEGPRGLDDTVGVNRSQ